MAPGLEAESGLTASWGYVSVSGAWGGCGSGQRTLKVFRVSQGHPHASLLPEGADRLSLFSAPHPTVQSPDPLVQLFRWPQWQGAHPSVGRETDRREVKRPAHGPQLVMGGVPGVGPRPQLWVQCSSHCWRRWKQTQESITLEGAEN